MKYRKRPVVIEAVPLTWQNWSEVCAFAGVGHLYDGKPEGGWAVPGQPDFYTSDDRRPKPEAAVMALAIPTLEGLMVANEYDFIIKGVKGELYPCKPDIFALTYEPAE